LHQIDDKQAAARCTVVAAAAAGIQSFLSFPQKNPLEFTRDPFLDIEILKTLANFFGDLVAVDERKK
jgi:hypothetical protein